MLCTVSTQDIGLAAMTDVAELDLDNDGRIDLYPAWPTMNPGVQYTGSRP